MGGDVGGNRSGVRSDINVTPLIDVVLVLLIIFIVITPMLQRGKSVELPKASAAKECKNCGDPLFVTVTKEGEYYVEADKLDLDALTERLSQAAQAYKRVLVKADRDTDYEKVRPVLDRASKAKLKGVQLAAQELKR
jgi:biopolymer transport protein TolR